MQEYYNYIVATHIVFVVAWFAALFYIVRLYIYHTEALQKSEPEKKILSGQFMVMEKRLMRIIGTPAMIITLATGICLLSMQTAFLQQPWMHIKITFVVLVIAYHFLCLRIQKKLASQQILFTSMQLRMLTELATVFLVA
ncbi:MAG: CopD family protein, partial [Chitinophagales bacterium]